MTVSRIDICEVGPRDGLQSEARHWSVDERIELIERLARTGVRTIEAASFVDPRRVPQMAGAEEVMNGITRRAGVRYAGLALNMRGVERALRAGVSEVRCAVVASETFNQRNNGCSTHDTLSQFATIAAEVKAAGVHLSMGVAAAFGCPFEGAVDAQRVVALVQRLAEMGADDLWLADTIGAASPRQVRELFGGVRTALGAEVALGGHFHNTRNGGYANAIAALEEGAAFLDSSIGGIGGCPFAPRATGNIATEDLCHLLGNMGVATGTDLEQLIAIAQWTESMIGGTVPGMVMKAGAFAQPTHGAAP